MDPEKSPRPGLTILPLPIYRTEPKAVQYLIEEIELQGLPRKYCITEQLPKGGYSSIYKGFERDTNTNIIVKKCNHEDEFQRQIAAIVRLSSKDSMDYVVPILACFLDERYIVMPQMNRGTVWNLWNARRGLSPEETVAIISQAGKALEQIHTAGLVHNDIKSANILLTSPDAQPLTDALQDSALTAPSETLIAKLSDLGLSCSREGIELPYLEPIHGNGTPAYAAPEALAKDPELSRPTPLMDIYSLTLVVYEMLTGIQLYDDVKWEDVARRRWFEQIPPDERIPEPVLPVLRKGADLNPARRFQSVPEMISALEKAVRNG